MLLCYYDGGDDSGFGDGREMVSSLVIQCRNHFNFFRFNQSPNRNFYIDELNLKY